MSHSDTSVNTCSSCNILNTQWLCRRFKIKINPNKLIKFHKLKNNFFLFQLVTPVECILTSQISATPVVVFRNGHISPLDKALSRRKEVPSKESLLTKDETIIDAHLISVVGSVTVAMFTTTPQVQ